jgi:hypothetical protein
MYENCLTPFKALSYSHNLNEGHLADQKAVKLSTYGILFIGCPHQGGTSAGMATILARMASVATPTNTKVLQHLQRSSELLQEQQDRFLSISRDFVIKFFYEVYKTKVPGYGHVHVGYLSPVVVIFLLIICPCRLSPKIQQSYRARPMPR